MTKAKSDADGKAANEPWRHHYVPQFYLKRFACADDANKVRVLERHGDVIVSDRKSIDGIGYEEALHDYVENGVASSIEGALNRIIETPFSRGETWQKIVNGACASLNERDRIPLYGFARHLQRRNLETLRFIEKLNAHYKEGALKDASLEEKETHAWIAASTDNAHAIFREGAVETALPPDADAINVMVCRSPVELRSSTNPTLLISTPGRQSAFGAFINDLRTWWLTLDRYWGAFIIAGGPPGFSINNLPDDAAHMVNRQYLIQHQNSLSVRYLIADDARLAEDLEWAGYERTSHSYRWRKAALVS